MSEESDPGVTAGAAADDADHAAAAAQPQPASLQRRPAAPAAATAAAPAAPRAAAPPAPAAPDAAAATPLHALHHTHGFGYSAVSASCYLTNKYSYNVYYVFFTTAYIVM